MLKHGHVPINSSNSSFSGRFYAEQPWHHSFKPIFYATVYYGKQLILMQNILPNISICRCRRHQMQVAYPKLHIQYNSV